MMQVTTSVSVHRDVAFIDGAPPPHKGIRLTKILLNVCGGDFFSFAIFDLFFLFFILILVIFRALLHKQVFDLSELCSG
jgi:hypothetical protein